MFGFNFFLIFLISLISLPLFLIIKKTRKLSRINIIIILLFIITVYFPVFPYYNPEFIIKVKNKNNENLPNIKIELFHNRSYLKHILGFPAIDPVYTREKYSGKYKTDSNGEIKINKKMEFLKLYQYNPGYYTIYSNLEHTDINNLNIYELDESNIKYSNPHYKACIIITAAHENEIAEYKKYYIKWIQKDKMINIILHDNTNG